MKKLLIASTLILGATLAMFSCNNGPYDAQPSVDNSSGLNPISGDTSGVSVFLGSLEGTVNNKKLLFAPAFYYTDENGYKQFVARVKDDSIFHRTLRMTFKGLDVIDSPFRVNAETADPYVSFVMLDTSRVDLAGRKIYKTYAANTGDAVGYATIQFLGEEGDNYRGYMFGRYHRVLPEKQLADTITMEYSQFYFRKVDFPVPDEYKEYLSN